MWWILCHFTARPNVFLKEYVLAQPEITGLMQKLLPAVERLVLYKEIRLGDHSGSLKIYEPETILRIDHAIFSQMSNYYTYS